MKPAAEPVAAPDPDPETPRRKKQKTLPPPPPGSAERKALEDAIVEHQTPLPVVPAVLDTPRTTSKVPSLVPKTSGGGDAATSGSFIAKDGGAPPEGGAPRFPRAQRVASLLEPGPARPAAAGAKPAPPPATPRAIAAATPQALPAATPAAPPPVPAAAKRSLAVPAVETHDEPTAVEDGPPGAMPKLRVPVGEFGDDAGTELEPAKLRIAHEQATMKRDPANALLQIAEPPVTVVREPPVEVLLGEAAHALRGDPTGSATVLFERGDPTRGDATSISPPSDVVTTPGTKLRSSAALRRKRGIAGDVSYVATVLFGVRRARRELEELEVRQETRKQSRRRALITLGRAAITVETFDHPALGPAREQLAAVEDERSRHAAQVIAADAELARVKQDRADTAKQHAEELAAAESELAESAKKLEKLEKEAAAINKRASELREALRRIADKIAATEASMGSLKAQQADKASLEAELASLRADRQGVLRDEPKIASELDAISPRIAALEARRSELRTKRADIEKAERDDQGRSDDLLAAIGAKRKVVDRASADAESLRDKILFELGERLYVDRPKALTGELSPADAIDVELGTSDRRVMELREILASIDKLKLARGIAVLVLALAAVGALVWLIYPRAS